MTAIITDKKLHTMSSEGPRAFYLCRVTCPGCKHQHRLGFVGWSAITCQGCQVVLYRNSASEAAA